MLTICYRTAHQETPPALWRPHNAAVSIRLVCGSIQCKLPVYCCVFWSQVSSVQA